MFSGGQSKGRLQNQGDPNLFLIHEVCFTVLFGVVIISVSKVKEVVERKYIYLYKYPDVKLYISFWC